MLSETDVNEQVNIAYLHAVSSKLRFQMDQPKIDRDSVDVTLKAKTFCLTGEAKQSGVTAVIDFQLKATSKPNIDEKRNLLIFPISVKNYNDLREDCLYPRYLAVMTLPKNRKHWVELSYDSLKIQERIYWLSLKGFESTQNKKSVTLHIPLTNLLTEDTLLSMMNAASLGEDFNG